MEWNNILPIITLVIGAILSPAIERFFKRGTERQRIKNEMIENVYVFFNFLKLHCQTINHNYYNDRKVVIAVNKIQGIIDEAKDKGAPLSAEQIKFHQSLIAELQSKYQPFEYFEKLTYIEAKLARINIESGHLFRQVTAAKISEKVIEILELCNDVSQLTVFNYAELTEIELYKTVAQTLGSKIFEKEKELQTKCDLHLKDLTKIFALRS